MVSPGGIEAWLVQDTKVPLLSIKFFFKGGVETDPAGKEGLANLTSTVLDEGAGPYDSEEFQRRLADNSISISFNATTDGFYGGVHTLVETQDEAVDLARLALTQPRFDEEAVERMRRGVLTQIRRDQGDPDFLARRALYETAFPDHPYGRRARGTVESVGSITRDDMAAFVRQRFAKDNLTVAVTGDITPEQLGPVLDRIFGALPAKAAVKPPADTVPKGAGETVLVPRPQPQTVVLMGQPGIKRERSGLVRRDHHELRAGRRQLQFPPDGGDPREARPDLRRLQLSGAVSAHGAGDGRRFGRQRQCRQDGRADEGGMAEDARPWG